MAQWGRNDQAVTANSTTTVGTSTGAPIGTWALVNGASTSNISTIAVSHGTNGHFGNTSTGSRAAVDVGMFGNTTQNAFRQGQAVGVFGIDAVEMGVTKTGAAHAGWVLRTVGSGGRAGRVQTEVLVAMGSLGVNTSTSTGVTGATTTVKDASDDAILPDA